MSFQAASKRDKEISKKLCFLLRHGAVKKGLAIRPDGFVEVSKVLKAIADCSLIDLQRIVATDDKQRFTLHVGKELWIKANQGHSIAQVNSLSIRYLINVSFDIIHGTYFSQWEKIRSEGISRMTRNHIHFAKGLNFICGLRQDCEVFIYIDFPKASRDGIKFYESENNVILSPGDFDGYIKPQYFLKVITQSG
ncbi:tRNA 2'-phosphotransferase 1 [Phymastichus coffea]|uniref:tRNA 2'-phosphotransferase 1 n=1 Tax=Phymastichus coffea TaxID=108790 RepID=UPI00273B950E|nr:tRNA 2'-phosphotransferase 1 [Phymastichus coffea]